jgi:hypothetical protein
VLRKLILFNPEYPFPCETKHNSTSVSWLNANFFRHSVASDPAEQLARNHTRWRCSFLLETRDCDVPGGRPPEADEVAERGEERRATRGREEGDGKSGRPHGQSFSHGRGQRREWQRASENLLRPCSSPLSSRSSGDSLKVR